MMYEGFAAVYDALMADVDYARWAAYYLSLAQKYGVFPRWACDCACGTGNLTLELFAAGVAMTGLDLSSDMLRVAGEKARGRGMQLPFIRQDMRKLLLHRPVDAVFCACDGVNYLLRPDDARAFFAAAFAALRPGGGLFFDVSSPGKLAGRLGNNCLCGEEKTVSYLWQNHFDRASHTLQMDLTFFVRAADGRYTRFAETHFQRAHEIEELLLWLREAGFTQADAFGDQTFATPGAEEERIHFAAIRPV
ncbi:MAG: class I SAM-dependent methyltransferase [Firmicutes bacterium]|nr:class I SAM-dependent methyltransferase [Bacillota bacterium]